MNEEQMEQALREMAAAYHAPPETPKDEMWTRIEAARRGEAGRRRTTTVLHFPVWRVAAAAAAVLVAGVAIGRFSAPDGDTVQVVTTGPPAVELAAESQVAFRVAASEHLNDVETFLTVFRAEARLGPVSEADYLRPARHLLFQTRMLQDSPIARDLALKTLLDDVELVLAQIAQYSDDRAGDLEFIDQGIEQRGVMLKLRSAIPAGPPQVSAQGAL